MSDGCGTTLDPLRLVREGANQDGRFDPALDPDAAPVDGRGEADGVVFASRLARYLRHFKGRTADGDWSAFFTTDPAVPLALASLSDTSRYRDAMLRWQSFLNSLGNAGAPQPLRDHLGYILSAIASVAVAIDKLMTGLPDRQPLKAALDTIIRSELGPALQRMVLRYNAGKAMDLVSDIAPAPGLAVLTSDDITFASLRTRTLSTAWSQNAPWQPYIDDQFQKPGDAAIYGTFPVGEVFGPINHCVTHALFRADLALFSRAYARAVSGAGAALGDTLDSDQGHEPHYALFLSALKLLGLARATGNRFTARHLDFYYRTILGLAERPARPGRVHLLAELARQTPTHALAPGTLFKAGKDSLGRSAVFASQGQTVLNQAKTVSFRTLYRHTAEKVDGSDAQKDRFFASPVANSADGLGGPFTGADTSWHPFFNKVYDAGALKRIAMPRAAIGFAIASHHLLLAEGRRTITLAMKVKSLAGVAPGLNRASDLRCTLTTAEGWLEKPVLSFGPGSQPGSLTLVVELGGEDAAIRPHDAAIHGTALDTVLPVMSLSLKQDTSDPTSYAMLAAIELESIVLTVAVEGLRSLAVSNDFGPLDTSRPFQPYGPNPIGQSSFVIGSREAFQKPLTNLTVRLPWQTAFAAYGTAALPRVNASALVAGVWQPISWSSPQVDAAAYTLGPLPAGTIRDGLDLAQDAAYAMASRHGYLRFGLTGDFGQDAYRAAIATYFAKGAKDPMPAPQPVIPDALALSLDYTAQATTALDTADAARFEARTLRFFHVTPFGAAEQHPALSGGDAVTLLPRFASLAEGALKDHEAEFYIGIAGLKPPQDLTLLFAAVDGTANPLALKPPHHITWSYLSRNRWTAFPREAVQDGTSALLSPGIVRLAMPRDATDANTLLPSGLHWIRIAVHERSDAVCRLLLVAAQAIEAIFEDHGNAPEFSATPLPPGTISKLQPPVPAVKSVSQPFASFGGRGREAPRAFYTRVSERLRHKDRAVTLWDYERHVLSAFPEVYKAKCLPHTRYEASASGAGIYNELAAGHVTLVVIPRVAPESQRDPLKPYASLGLLQDIKAHLDRRASCFADITVSNPQFEEVRLSLKLRLREGYDETYFSAELQRAITRFLSPWAFSGGSPSFGGRIHKPVLINFIEDQPYVDYIAEVKMFRDIGGVDGSEDLDSAEASLAVSILVSAPPSRHSITVIEDTTAAAAETCGCDA